MSASTAAAARASARPNVRGTRAAAVVLAAGRSRRMGSPKAQLRLGGETLLERVVRTLLEGGVDPGVVVTGAPPRPSAPPPFTAVYNERWREGMLASVQAGVRALRPSPAASLLLAPVDCPAFSAATVAALLRAWRSARAPVVVPVWRGRRGHPALFDRGVWDELLRAPAAQGARAVVRAHAAELLEVPVEDPYVVRDVDTPRQYRRLCDELGVPPMP